MKIPISLTASFLISHAIPFFKIRSENYGFDFHNRSSSIEFDIMKWYEITEDFTPEVNLGLFIESGIPHLLLHYSLDRLQTLIDG